MPNYFYCHLFPINQTIKLEPNNTHHNLPILKNRNKKMILNKHTAFPQHAVSCFHHMN
jgi:hypothetical protein